MASFSEKSLFTGIGKNRRYRQRSEIGKAGSLVYPIRMPLSLRSLQFLAMAAVLCLAAALPAADLDATPVLIEQPNITMPKSFHLKGIALAKVTLEVMISTDGSVTVRKVIKSPHEEFTKYAIEFATKSRFNPPTKNGKPVEALLKWPILLVP